MSYQWTCSVGSLSTTCTGTTNTPTCDVNVHGAACCPVSSGGTCTGQLCAINCQTPETCHVKATEDGVCRPSCGYLATLQGYGGYGPDRIIHTADDPHVSSWYIPNASTSTTCADLNTQQLWGSTDWIKIPLIENKEPWIIAASGGGACCGRNITSTPCDSNVECCDGDSHPSNPHCPPGGYDCHCTYNGCIPGCDKDTNINGTWICENPKGGADSGTCKVVCECTGDGCSEGCDKDTNTDGTWICESPKGGIDSGTCKAVCECTDNGCSAGCDKDTNTDGTWICESTTDGGTDSGTCSGACDSSTECCDGDSSPDVILIVGLVTSTYME